MSDLTTTLPEGIEPSISRLTVGRLNHWAMEANGCHLMSDPTTMDLFFFVFGFICFIYLFNTRSGSDTSHLDATRS